MKKGSTLIEAVISMAILLIALTLSTQIFSLSSKSIVTRRNKEKANRVSYAIEKEIKYNTKFEDIADIKGIFVNNNLYLKYKDDIIDSLLTNTLLSLERKNIIESKSAIIIEKKITNSAEKNYEIETFKITIYDSNGGILNEREFIKSYWMEI